MEICCKVEKQERSKFISGETMEKEMKPIWFFVGLMLTIIGTLIMASSLYDYFNHGQTRTVLAHLHPGMWWSAVIIVAGIVFVRIKESTSR